MFYILYGYFLDLLRNFKFEKQKNVMLGRLEITNTVIVRLEFKKITCNLPKFVIYFCRAINSSICGVKNLVCIMNLYE